MPGLLLIMLLGDAPSLAPQWKVGQEYLYRGTVKEMGPVQDWQVIQEYSLELRILVTQVRKQNAEVICFTKLIQKHQPNQEEALSIHLTQVMVDARGHISSCTAPSGKVLVVDRPATWENGFFLPLPPHTIEPGGTWEATEPGRLPRRFTWKPVADNMTAQVVTSDQESIDWQRPRGDSTAWRRSDKLTFTSRANLPTHVERLIERRAPAHRQVTSRFITEYTLQSVETLAGPMLEARREDIEKIKAFQSEVTALSIAPHDKETRLAWQKLETRLTAYQGSVGNTPYRESLTTLHFTIQAGLDNRLSPIQFMVQETSIEKGQLVPPFTLLTEHGESVTSAMCRGKPTLLVFVQPGSELTKLLMHELPLWQRRGGKQTFHCLLLAAKTGALAKIESSPSALMMTAMGQPLLAMFGVTDTPHFILLDADGALVASVVGWGPETRNELERLMKKELAKVR